jgi:hypothetical protein
MEENEPNPELDDQLMKTMLSNPTWLLEQGYRITPKGIVTMFLATLLEKSLEEVEPIAQQIDDAIFLNGWIYVQEGQIKLADDPADG